MVTAIVSLWWDITGRIPRADVFKSLDLSGAQLCESQSYRVLPGARCRDEEGVIDVVPVGSVAPPAAAASAATSSTSVVATVAAPTASTTPASATATPVATPPSVKQLPHDVQPSAPPAEKLRMEIVDAGGIELLEVLVELMKRRGVDEVANTLKNWVA